MTREGSVDWYDDVTLQTTRHQWQTAISVYESLLLLHALDPTREARRSDLLMDRGMHSKEKLWRNFLDQLCFLCDSEKGGDTVTSIAAERKNEGSIFWIASNSNAGEKAAAHVEWILSQLNRLHDGDAECENDVRERLLTECTKFCAKRIKSYVSLLTSSLTEQRKLLPPIPSEDGQLIEALQLLIDKQDDTYALCVHAYQLRREPVIGILQRKHITAASAQWANIRHNFGRLGCWVKAVEVLIQATYSFPRSLEGAQVMLVPGRGPANRPPSQNDADIKRLVGRLVSANAKIEAQNLEEALMEHDSISQCMATFKKKYATFEPRAHAEALVLEFFHEDEKDFVENDRYIGCSKPSCYCCSLYFKYHPGKFQERACHGNLWPNWAPPIPLPVIQGGKKDKNVRPKQHPTFQLLQKMFESIKADLCVQILSRRPKRSRVPDTSTGMSSVIIPIGNDGWLSAVPEIQSRTLLSISAGDTGNEAPDDGESFERPLSTVCESDDSRVATTDLVPFHADTFPQSSSDEEIAFSPKEFASFGVSLGSAQPDDSSSDDDVVLFGGRKGI